MSPEGKTSIVVEYPCFKNEEIWTRDEDVLVKDLVMNLEKMGLIKESNLLGHDLHRLPDAYPVYSKGYKATSELVLSYLSQFKNLWTLGRGGSFFYGHLHDFVTDGFSTASSVDTYLKQEATAGV